MRTIHSNRSREITTLFDASSPQDNPLLYQLAGVLAHEIRNPLTGISTTVQLLKERLEDMPGKYDGYCDIILEELERINGIISELVDFARPHTLQTVGIDIRELADKVIMLIEAEALSRNIAIERDYYTQEFVLECEPNRIKQALLNLIKNAMEAVDSLGTITVSIQVEEDDGGAKWCVLKIKDTGKGMNAEQRTRIFEPFFSTKTRGMGLGLPITKNIITQHQGSISVESGPDESGTEFVIRFPQNISDNVNP